VRGQIDFIYFSMDKLFNFRRTFLILFSIVGLVVCLLPADIGFVF